MNTTPSSHGSGRGNASNTLDADGLRIWSCVLCRRRKVRCDRREPCANCVRHGVDCHYPVTGRIPRRRPPPAGHPDKHSVLIGRLRRLESIVTELSAQVEGVGPSPTWQMPLRQQQQASRGHDDHDDGCDSAAAASQSTDSGSLGLTSNNAQAEEMGDEDFGRLVTAKDGVLHIGNRFWTVFCDEVHNIFNAVDEMEFAEEKASDPAPSASSSSPTAGHHNGYIFGTQPGAAADTAHLRPQSWQIPYLWQVYLDNVDPFVKVLHTPTTAGTILRLGGGSSSVTGPDAETEALLFAISLAAVVSLEEAEISSNLGQSRSELLGSYGLGTEMALARVGLPATRSLVVVQAFVIYLSVLPHAEQEHRQLSWTLTGLLLRIATSLGLHRDESHQPGNMSFVDAEMRRRLWWQISLVDSRSRDPRTPELSVSEFLFDASIPVNVDDCDLESAVASSLVMTGGAGKITSATLLLIRCQLWRLGRTIESNRDKTVETQLCLVRDVQTNVRSTYLANLDAQKPLDCLIQSMTTLFFGKINVLLYSRALEKAKRDQAGQSQSAAAVTHIRRELFGASLEIIEAVDEMRTRPEWARWRWQIQGDSAPWHAIAVVLGQLSDVPWSVKSERAWGPTQRLFESSLETRPRGVEGRFSGSLGELLERARSRRQEWAAATREAPVAQDTGPCAGAGLVRGERGGCDNSTVFMSPAVSDLAPGLLGPSLGSWTDGDAYEAPDGIDPMEGWMLDDMAGFSSDYYDLGSM